MVSRCASYRKSFPCEQGVAKLVSFAHKLQEHGLGLTRGQTTVLQVNLGRLCNQACRHCHLEAGPGCREVMGLKTARQVAAYARRGCFGCVDITGGAPELNPHLAELLELVRPFAQRVMLRCNLTALGQPERAGLMQRLADLRIDLVASFPALNQAQCEAQRGAGVFGPSLDTLARLNELGYGRQGSGLALDLVVNPTGAFLPPDQGQAERRYRREMLRKWGISFNRLYTFANVPLGRFRSWLKDSGNYDGYLQKLCESFNPCAVDGLMCRSSVSVDWQGQLYDCDFNLAAGLPLGGRPVHVSQMEGPPEAGAPIAAGEHCFTCTAGAGFT